jgi:ferrous iron transport protein A
MPKFAATGPDPSTIDVSAALSVGASPVRPAPAPRHGATLDALGTGVPAVVHAVAAPPSAPEWALWLDEIGFFPGERVMVTARGIPGGDPLVVRVGNSTFALRRAEAACIRLEAAGR